MPVYEYACKECGNRFEKMQPITADALKDCPHCGKSALHRVFHPVGVIFKGSGWYITDNRNSNSNSSTSGSASKASDKPTSTEKSDTKSEAPSSESSSSSTPPSTDSKE
jgi:putative FmdB family regulatory protein